MSRQILRRICLGVMALSKFFDLESTHLFHHSDMSG
jgi:hypothetical protein